MPDEAAVNPIPWPALAVVMVLIAVEVVLSLAGQGLIGGPGGIGWRINAVTDWGFSPVVWEQVAQRGNFDPFLLRRFVSYLFIHGAATDALFGGAILLALGKFVGEVIGNMWLLALMVATALAGAATFGIFLTGPQPLYGIWPVDYGLIGAFTYLTWLRLKETGGQTLRAFQLIGVLLVLQLIFSLFFGTNKVWVAEIGGFGAGFVLAVPAAPGGWQRLVSRLRQRSA